MTATTIATATATATGPAPKKRRKGMWSQVIINGLLILLVLGWTIPTVGLLVSSFRTRTDIQTSGWWTIFPHREWETVKTIPVPEGMDRTGVMAIEGANATFEQFREGVTTPDGEYRLTWVGNRRTGKIQIQQQVWTRGNHDFTLENYQQVLGGKTFEIKTPEGVQTVQGDNFIGAFLNSLTVTIPATVIPILIAAFAAYGFAWMRFPGRRVAFVLVVALLVVPLQIAFVPILKDYKALGLNGTYLGVWLAHTGFGLPLATYLLFNYISGLPRDILESAFIDGASHFTIFMRLIIPLSIPALASFAIFQFLWVWNDYLVALIFLGSAPGNQVLTMRLAEMVGSRGNDWHLLTAGAFISMILPLAVFFGLQRFFVRGLLAGSVKG
jgi:alpha-glucoside transport system permease protein